MADLKTNLLGFSMNSPIIGASGTVGYGVEYEELADFSKIGGISGKDEKCVDKALRLIKVEYEVLDAVLDYHTAKDNPVLVHPEETGRPSARLEPTTNATFVPMVRRETATLKLCWQTAISSLNTPTIPRPASRP